MDFFMNLDWMMLIRAFAVGGALCVIGQILVDKTKLTSARILVIFVTAGVLLGSIGIYQKLVDFAGCRCNCSFNRFWKSSCKRRNRKSKI